MFAITSNICFFAPVFSFFKIANKTPIATMAIATLYNRLIKVEYFYFISICVEIVILIIVLAVLIFSLNPTIAAIVYTGYQLTFFFGSYLVRCETLLLESKKFLSKVDILKQLGYLAGLAT